jgi:hypothetical protein
MTRADLRRQQITSNKDSATIPTSEGAYLDTVGYDTYFELIVGCSTTPVKAPHYRRDGGTSPIRTLLQL